MPMYADETKCPRAAENAELDKAWAEIEGLEIDNGKLGNVVHLIAFFVNDLNKTDAERLAQIRKTLENFTSPESTKS